MAECNLTSKGKEFPLDERCLFDIFADFEFVRPHKGALVFPTADTVLVQFEANKGKVSPGFLVCLQTEPGQCYILETNGFLHEGKKAFIYAEAKREGETGNNGMQEVGATGVTGCYERLIPRDKCFLNCETASFKIPFTAISEHTVVGILFYCNTMDYCLSLCQFRVYKSSGQQKLDGYPCGDCGYRSYSGMPQGGYALSNDESCRCHGKKKCAQKCERKTCSKKCPKNCSKKCYDHCGYDCYHERRNTSCGNGCGSCGNGCGGYNPQGYYHGEIVTPCSKCWDPCGCPVKAGKTGPIGPLGPVGPTGRAGTRTYCLDLSRRGFAGKALPTLNCTMKGALFLEHANGKTGCCKLWECDGTQFQWITPDPADYAYYNDEGLQIWLVQDATCTQLPAGLGDLAFDSDTGAVLVGNAKGQWVEGDCNIKGPTGPTGPMGVTGSIGLAGPTGPEGASNGVVTEALVGSDIVITLNDPGSLTNLVNMSLSGASSLSGLVRWAPDALNPTQSCFEVQGQISALQFADIGAGQTGNMVSPGQSISGVITLGLSNLLTNKGFQNGFVGTAGNKVPILGQVQQSDSNINGGFSTNVFATLADDSSQVRFVIVFYNNTPNTVLLSTFSREVFLSFSLTGKVVPL